MILIRKFDAKIKIKIVSEEGIYHNYNTNIINNYSSFIINNINNIIINHTSIMHVYVVYQTSDHSIDCIVYIRIF